MEKSQDRKYTNLITENRPDNYFITTCITLLGAFTVLFISGNPLAPLVRYTIIVSVFCLICALMTLIWYKFRFSLRDKVFERKREKLIGDYSSKLAAYYEDIYEPLMFDKIEYEINKNPQADKTRIREEVTKEIHKTNESIISSFVKNLSSDMQISYIEAYDKPLNESLADLKLMIDKFSNRTRYFWFGLGVIFFFVSIVIQLA